MRVAVERSLWVSVRGVVACKIPDDQRLVAGSREKHVGAFSYVSLLHFPALAPCAHFSREVARLVTQPE